MITNIPIKNIYYMLSYAFKQLQSSDYKGMATEEFENTSDLFAEILSIGVEKQLKRYLNREYITESDSLSCIRGKIEINASLKSLSILKKKLICSYDEFSINSYMNRVLKSCMMLLLKSDININRKKKIKSLLAFFSTVTILDVHHINWHFKFNHSNKTYELLIGICYLLVNGLIQTNDKGSTKLMDFLDEQRMCRLYEKFILEYYKQEHHNEVLANASQIEWISDDKDLLPIMQSDVMLSRGNKVLIIDAKYYSHNTQVKNDTHSIHSQNLYQIFTYVKNKEEKLRLLNDNHEVSGMLLYAKTNDDFQVTPHDYMMSGNMISVRTMDLNCNFTDLKKQLDDILIKYGF